jgi:hypothetical protein
VLAGGAPAQAELQLPLSKLIEHAYVRAVGSGRTTAGSHSAAGWRTIIRASCHP